MSRPFCPPLSEADEDSHRISRRRLEWNLSISQACGRRSLDLPSLGIQDGFRRPLQASSPGSPGLVRAVKNGILSSRFRRVQKTQNIRGPCQRWSPIHPLLQRIKLPPQARRAATVRLFADACHHRSAFWKCEEDSGSLNLCTYPAHMPSPCHASTCLPRARMEIILQGSSASRSKVGDAYPRKPSGGQMPGLITLRDAAVVLQVHRGRILS